MDFLRINSILLPLRSTEIKEMFGEKMNFAVQKYRITGTLILIGSLLFCSIANMEVRAETEEIVHTNAVLKFSDGGKTVIGVTNNKVEYIVIPDGVTRIGDRAFLDCSSLRKITIPESVTHIGEDAFWGCTSLIGITIPGNMMHIGARAFYRCRTLRSITVPESVTSIGEDAFLWCSSLVSVVLPEHFAGQELQRFRFPSSCRIYHSVADAQKSKAEMARLEALKLAAAAQGLKLSDDCKTVVGVTEREKVKKIVLPSSVTAIGDRAFWDCIALRNITIPDSVTSIGEDSFAHCSALWSITIPDSVTSIGKNAFSGCSALKNVTIPKRVTAIGNGAFDRCDSLTGIILPEHFSDEDAAAWGLSQNCRIFRSVAEARKVKAEMARLDALKIAAASQKLKLSDDCETVIGVTDREKVKKIELPRSITKIENNAFEGCAYLVKITIPPSVTDIGDRAFSGCSSLLSVTIPSSVTAIGEGAFSNCASLKKLTIPAHFTNGDVEKWGVFSDCQIIRK